MLENPISPAMYVADPASLESLDEKHSAVIAAENFAIPGSDQLYVQKVRLHMDIGLWTPILTKVMQSV